MDESAIKNIENIKSLIERGFKNGENYYSLGKAYEICEDYVNAARNLGIACGYTPNEPLYWDCYAAALQKLQMLERSKASLQQAIVLGANVDSYIGRLLTNFNGRENGLNFQN